MFNHHLLNHSYFISFMLLLILLPFNLFKSGFPTTVSDFSQWHPVWVSAGWWLVTASQIVAHWVRPLAVGQEAENRKEGWDKMKNRRPRIGRVISAPIFSRQTNKSWFWNQERQQPLLRWTWEWLWRGLKRNLEHDVMSINHTICNKVYVCVDSQ